MNEPEIYDDCEHPQSHHTERLAPGLPLACPLPCECVGFRLCAAPAAVYTAPLGEVDAAAADALRCFGPGTTEEGRAEAGWLPAGRIVGAGPDILPEPTIDARER